MVCCFEFKVSEVVGEKGAGLKLGNLPEWSAWYCKSSQSYILMILPKRDRMNRRLTIK